MILRPAIAWLCAVGATAWSSDGNPLTMTAHTSHSYRVELIGSSYPSWFDQLAIAGLRRAGKQEAADLVIQVEALPPEVTWTAWVEPEAAISPLRMERRLSVLAGVGSHRCSVVVLDSSMGTVVAAFDVSVQQAALRWSPPQPDYRVPSSLPVVLPEGRAWAWGQQAWAEAFERIDRQLADRLGRAALAP